jgi:hypothetical protein
LPARTNLEGNLPMENRTVRSCLTLFITSLVVLGAAAMLAAILFATVS